MNLTILQNKLKEGLNIIERISSKSLSLPFLKNALLKAEKNFLNLSATDLEIGIKWWALAKVEKEGEVAIPISLLSGFINFLPEKPIKLIGKEQSLFIECDDYKTQIKGNNPEEFPIIPKIPENKLFSTSGNIFCHGLNQVLDIAATSTTRPEISGVYVSIQKNSIKMVATDSFRLGEKIIFFEKPLKIEEEASLIIPQKTAKEIVNIFGEKENNLNVFLTSNQILFELLMEETSHPKIHLISRLIEGDYPNYQEIIPKKYETQVILKRNDFLNQVKAASLFSGNVNEVKFKIDPQKGGIDIFSQNPDSGNYQSFLAGNIKGKKEEISFNYKFLAEGLLKIKSSEIIFELNGDSGPGVLKPVGDNSYIYIVMPIRGT